MSAIHGELGCGGGVLLYTYNIKVGAGSTVEAFTYAGVARRRGVTQLLKIFNNFFYVTVAL